MEGVGHNVSSGNFYARRVILRAFCTPMEGTDVRHGSLIIGCGYLGTILAHQLGQTGTTVFATSRSPERLATLKNELGASGILFDPADPQTHSIQPVLDRIDRLDVFCLLPPSALADTLSRERLKALLQRLPVNRAVLTSSTGIYGECAGGIVTATTEIRPVTERERRLCAIEECWSELPGGRIVRLAGIYGPGRVIGARALREGRPVPGEPSALLNLIHAADAVGLLRRCMHPQGALRIEVGSDGTPVVREDYYRFLAREIGAAPPVFDRTRGDGDQGKAVDPSSSYERLGWWPRFPSYREGLPDALGTEGTE